MTQNDDKMCEALSKKQQRLIRMQALHQVRQENLGLWTRCANNMAFHETSKTHFILMINTHRADVF